MPRTDMFSELRFKEAAGVAEQLAREQYQLAEWMETNTGADFKNAMNIVLEQSGELLPGYQGTAKLIMFRKEIRDTIMGEGN